MSLDKLTHALEAELPAAIALRHTLHAAPEPSGGEWRTATRIANAIGAGESEAVADTGRVVRVGPPSRRVVAVRAELDGLPVHERDGQADAASNGFMHACGHDVHMAAVAALARAAHTLDLPMLAVLQPREEQPPSGARDIVADGVLEKYGVGAIVGAHVQPLLAKGEIAATPGAVNAATDQFTITVTGHGGHGGYPHLARDPVLAMAQVIVALQQVVSRRLDPLHAAVLSIGAVHAGAAPNVIPDCAVARGTLRVLDESDRDTARKEMTDIVAQVAAGYGCRGGVTIHEGEPALVNDTGLALRTQGHLEQLGFTLAPELRSCGADDFSWYGDQVTSLMMFVGLDDPHMLHHPSFHPSDETVRDVALALAAGYMAALAGI
ncbi:M20 metallopeptidase family protein [Nocardioides sp. Kera G14]|uniref:M20 metallopeptidase family protein n=1 Tax=Nocardioides sp. Kera G14 TaxID=2884264 RepID=UPI001D110D9C|nr:amidohydrolase [Nocardioides sp. Kera G14]UDY24656.1 amidohydrolase [Nocardioides sp. Kera G14]